MFVIGTAGHVDHGKSTLIKNLTNIDPDRLIEEKKREMTIELGFSWFYDDNNLPIGVIDVPGHEELVDNMVKGVYGIDLGLLVVSAVESVKEQTIEHLEILKISNVKKIILVLTKKDLVSEEILLSNTEESMLLLKNKGFSDVNYICIDSNNNEDIQNLRNVIINELKTITHLSTSDSPRMYIDRVFHKKGHGTIVTGTLINGVFETDENIYIDGKLKSKIRSMEAYENSVSRAESKVRLAMNLSNINYSDLKRGSVITNNDKNVLHKSFVANIRMTDSYAKSIKHNSIVEVFIGSSQAKGRLIFYDSKILNKDQSTYALIKLDNLIHYRIYDKVILRSSGTTIAGGEILSPGDSTKIFKSKKFNEYLNFMSAKDFNSALIDLLKIKKILNLNQLAHYFNLNYEFINKIVNEIKSSLIVVKSDINAYFLVDKNWHKNKLKLLIQILNEYKNKYPLRIGMNKNEAIQRLYPQFSDKISNLLTENLIQTKYISKQEDKLFLSTENNLEKNLPKGVELIIDKLNQSKEPVIEQNLFDKEILAYLVQNSFLTNLSRSIYVKQEWFNKSKEIILKHFDHNDTLDIQTAKNLLTLSRKLTVLILEKLDSENITRRIDNKRILIK